MASMTSLYLCNRTVYAAVGSPARGGAALSVVCQAELPEGCLINGIITNEAALTDALKGFFAANALPAKRVALVLGGSQFQYKVLTLPDLPEKKLRPIVTKELGMGAESQTLDDWMLLHRDPKAHSQTVLATRVDRSVIEGVLSVAKGAGLTLCCIDIGLASIIKLVRGIPALAGKTFILLAFDGENLAALLFVQGQYSYSTRSRLFNTRGTPEAAAEIAQKLSGILQFHLTNKSDHRITDVYFAKCGAGELESCRPGAEALGLTVSMLPDAPGLRLPSGCCAADAVFAAGSFFGR